jgi:hypothetical protein
VRWLRELIPQLRLTTYPVKFVLLLTFVAPQLAAFALAQILQRSDSLNSSNPLRTLSLSHIVVLGAIMAMVIAFILVWAWRSPMPNDVPYVATLVCGGAGAVFVFSSVLVLRALIRSRASLVMAALLFVVWLDVFNHVPTQNPTVQPWIYEFGLAREKLNLQPAPVLGESRMMVSPAAELKFTQLTSHKPADNYIVKRLGLFADCNVLDDIPKVNGFFSLYPRESGELVSALYGNTNLNANGLMDFMGVAHVTSPEDFLKWQARTNFLPLITGGQCPVFLDDTNVLLAILQPDFDGSKVVFLPPGARAQVSVTNESSVQLAGWHFARERVECEVEAQSASLLVVAQSYYHRWHAFVDAQPAPLLRANYAFQAVPIPAGKHRVELLYQDSPFRKGTGISLAALLICVAGIGIGLRAKGQ